MSQGAYYNEHDPKAAQWLRELIKAGHIAPGDVDDRSILDVTPHDLDGYTQCHFFAGIGGWSLALRQAQWPDSRPVWTGSCPCQSFSTAGKRGGFADARHLWPAWFWLIRQCAPNVIFGEQVASAGAREWLDFVCIDLEATGHTVGAANLCVAGAGGPHIRQRLYWMANSNGGGLQRQRVHAGPEWESKPVPPGHGKAGLLAHGPSERPQGPAERVQGALPGHAQCGADGVEHAVGDGREQWRSKSGWRLPTGGRGEVSGFWSPADWLLCTDGKARPVEPGTFPLGHGLPARVGRLRGYGNAIVPEVAAGFIAAASEWLL